MDIFTQLHSIHGRPCSWRVIVGSESIFLYVTLHYVSPHIWFCGFNCIEFCMLFHGTVYSVAWRPSAFLRYRSLSSLPRTALFYWETLCSFLFNTSSAWFIKSLNNTGPSTNNFSFSLCVFEDYLSEWEASFLSHGFIASIKAIPLCWDSLLKGFGNPSWLYQLDLPAHVLIYPFKGFCVDSHIRLTWI